MARLVAVVGGKHSGKTTVIEHLVAQLKSRGFHVGVIKEMVRIPTLDTPATETDRYTVAGAEVVVAVPREETVVFIKKRLSIREILPHLRGLDFAVLEGFEKEKIPKIVVAKTAQELSEFMDGTVIAVSGLITDSPSEIEKAQIKVPILKSQTYAKELACLIEEKSVEIMP